MIEMRHIGWLDWMEFFCCLLENDGCLSLVTCLCPFICRDDWRIPIGEVSLRESSDVCHHHILINIQSEC